MPGYHSKKKPYAQNPYGPPGSYTENKKEMDENQPKQGFKSGEQLNTEILNEHLARIKGKTLLTTGLTY
jgi:hypothetical protein